MARKELDDDINIEASLFVGPWKERENRPERRK
jgi:hypothetical protein